MGEYVLYKNDKEKIIYRLINKNEQEVLIQGLNYRVRKIVPIEKIELADEAQYKIEQQNNNLYINNALVRKKTHKCLLGTILHIDSDEEYLKRCLKFYESIGVFCYPILCNAEDLCNTLKSLSIKFIPDVIVVTGHDLYNGNGKKDIENYTNSKYFIRGINILKLKYPNCVIIAGACQSHFEALIANGANFASSPKRVNVHVYDPAIIAVNVCVTSMRSIVDFEKLNKYIVSLKDSFGGIETYGKMKLLY